MIAFDKNAAVTCGDVSSDLEKRGKVIGANDLFITAHALSMGLTLATDNVKEFGRVRGLNIENWALD